MRTSDVMATDPDRSQEVLALREDQGEAAAALMARAFHDDPLFVHACPDGDERTRWLPWQLRWSVWKGFLFGVTWGTEGRLDGVATMFGPAGGEFTEEQLDRFGFRRGRDVVGAELWYRATAALNAAYFPVEDALQRAVPEPHWHFDLLGVDPARHGMGVGSRLMAAVHARSDADRVPVVLLTFQPRNLPLYERHGYVVVCAGHQPASGLDWWGMRRDPGA
jgi:ribosomal protein S18 acetylase RimI-like enzyme